MLYNTWNYIMHAQKLWVNQIYSTSSSLYVTQMMMRKTKQNEKNTDLQASAYSSDIDSQYPNKFKDVFYDSKTKWCDGMYICSIKLT